MNYISPEHFADVTATCKANIYFDGKVTSHTIAFADGRSKTLGLIYPGTYKFDTVAPEIMEIIAGRCEVRISDQQQWQTYQTNTYFEVPGNSHFTIKVTDTITEYVCSYK